MCLAQAQLIAQEANDYKRPVGFDRYVIVNPLRFDSALCVRSVDRKQAWQRLHFWSRGVGTHDMFERDDRGGDVYASEPMRRLRREQTRSLVGDVRRCSGTHALLLAAAVGDVPPSSPMLGCWTTLHIDKDRYCGDVNAAANEPLPFIDDAFQLVLLCHVLEVAPAWAAVLDDAIRMLAPGGVLIITGLHPVSSWAAWFWWRERRTVRRLHLPVGFTGALRGAGVEVERLTRVGRSWPARASAPAIPDNMFGGGYVLVARKRRQIMTRLRLSGIGAPLPNHGRLASEIRRSATQ